MLTSYVNRDNKMSVRDKHRRVVDANRVLLTALLLSAAMASVATAVQADESNNTAREGRDLYIKYGCYQCHGYEGQGGLISGPRIAPTGLPLDAFAAILRRPYGTMPAYSPNVLSDEILKGIHEYLRSIE